MANDLLQGIATIGILSFAFLLVSCFIVLVISLIAHFRKEQRTDSLKVIYMEIVALAKLNRPAYMLELYRLDMPPMNKYLSTVKKMIDRSELVIKNAEEVNKKVSR
jgi:hypothetical protein